MQHQAIIWPSVGVLLLDPWEQTSAAIEPVGIAQLAHHEVHCGGKNPETIGRGIFASTADRVVS